MTLTDFVSEQDGKANVDWKKLKRFRNRIFREGDGEKSFQPIFEQLLDYLTAKNILTYSDSPTPSMFYYYKVEAVIDNLTSTLSEPSFGISGNIKDINGNNLEAYSEFDVESRELRN